MGAIQENKRRPNKRGLNKKPLKRSRSTNDKKITLFTNCAGKNIKI
jgi:hypothetical protein